MSNENWTPGPWAVGKNGIHQLSDILKNQIVNKPSVHSENAPDYQYNARLIATAPDLYEALKYAAERLGTDGNDPVIDAALAKARAGGGDE